MHLPAKSLADLVPGAWRVIAEQSVKLAQPDWSYFFPQSELAAFRRARDQGVIVTVQRRGAEFFSLLAKLAAASVGKR